MKGFYVRGNFCQQMVFDDGVHLNTFSHKAERLHTTMDWKVKVMQNYECHRIW